MNPILMKAIVDFVLFLNLSGEEIVDLRAAVKHLEQLSVTLAELASDDRAVFAQYVRDLIVSEPHGRDYDRRIENLMALIEILERNHD